MKIPFNKPHLTHKELGYIGHAHSMGKLSGDGYYTKLCNEYLEKTIRTKKSLLTHSCTAALEMIAILSDLKPGDEVIMPSFTFVSTANAFVLRGIVPVFVDIREDNLNMDEKKIEAAISSKTKAIMVVHYAGVSSDMDKIKDLAKKFKLLLFEDAAQALLSTYKGQYLGTLGDLAAISYHETKNVISGEGGALLINNKKYHERAEIIREKGTDRSRFLRGMVDKYTWVDIGSSFLPSEITAAFLYAQLEDLKVITKKRLQIWEKYNKGFKDLEKNGVLKRQWIPSYNKQNAHMFYLLLPDIKTRTKFINFLFKREILSVFHYIPLHSSPAGIKYGRTAGELPITDSVSERLVRLPLFVDLQPIEQEYVIQTVYDFFKKN